MNGKIGKDSSFYIERAGILKKQYCPYVEAPTECADSCPLFGEPDYQTEEDLTVLELCNGKVLFFESLTDERGKE